MLNLKIVNGTVLDGTGSPAICTDVGVSGETIRDLGDLSAAESMVTLDASGKIVCPGFIDAHSHSDAYLLIEPSAPSKIYQGITTEVVGNCGASAAPLVGNYHMPSDWLDKKYPGSWHTVSEYRRLLEKVAPAPNVVLLAGHNTLRVGVAGYENRTVTDSELAEMIRLLEQSMDEGARGLSTGLIYAPGKFASAQELTALAGVAAKHEGIYTSHMRSEGKHLPEAVREAVGIGKASGVRVELSHLKVSGRDNWGLIDEVLDFIEKSRSGGVDVAADRYPYTSSQTDLDVVFPDWAGEGGRESILERLRNASDRSRLRDDLLKSRSDDYWSTVTIGSTSHPDNKRFQGMPLPEVARRLGMEPVDAVLHLADSDELKTSAFFSGMNEDNMMRILGEPYVMIGTDASLRSPTGPLSEDHPHPRAYGSFPRFLRMALDGKTVPLAEAVKKMTSLPARQFRLKDRGIIARGRKADIVVFAPKAVRDKATYSDPHQLALGIEHVIISGVLTLTDGRLTGHRAGRFL